MKNSNNLAEKIDENIPVHEITLEKIKHNFNLLVSQEYLERIQSGSLSIRVLKGPLEGAIIQLEKDIWAEKKMDKTHTYQTYKSWWEHTKERFAPKWFLKRWPVHFITHKIRFKSFAKFPALMLWDDSKYKTIRWFDMKEVWEE